jgi:ABC-type nitrate/sulfonate/bicarbonate transport system permease component
MDLWEALGVTRQQALVGALVGLVVALALAANAVLRRGRE